MKHFTIIRILLLATAFGALASCGHSSTEINTTGGSITNGNSCLFDTQTLSSVTKDSGQVVSTLINDAQLDSSRSFTYQVQPETPADMDTLMTGLCQAGFNVMEGIYVTAYFCKDSRGPRPVVVLTNSDSRIFSFREGFTQGATGRLSCAGSEIKYTPK